MDLINKLSSSLGTREQGPNMILGYQIADENDKKAVEDIKRLIATQKITLPVLCDLIKVLEAIGIKRPTLIAPLYPEVSKLIEHKQNHVVWRAMCVLPLIAPYNMELVQEDLSRILKAMDEGSVITRDHGFSLLVSLYELPTYRENMTHILSEQLMKAPDNQLGQYAEKWMAVINQTHIHLLVSLLENRLPDLEKEAHRKRTSKILLKLQN